jgi:hypothetical protein
LILRIPSVSIDDYEYSREVADPTWMVMPEVIPKEDVKAAKNRVFRYPGIKEDVYASTFEPRAGIRESLGITKTDLVVTMRPPATGAHYHNPESEKLFEAAINFIGMQENTRMVILPRDEMQKELIKRKWKQWYASHKIVIPDNVVDGLNLIWYSDLVISGGGTMNREAAALGVPVYSIFRGKIGAIDRYLAANGRLVLLEAAGEIPQKINLGRRQWSEKPQPANAAALKCIVETIESLVQTIGNRPG